MHPRPLLLAVALLLLAGCSRSEKVVANAFQWQAPLTPGATVHIRNTMGNVVVRGGGSGPVVVTASKRWKRGDEEDVRVVVVKEGSDLVFCSIYGKHGRCDSERYSASSRPGGLDRLLRMLSLRDRRRSDMTISYLVTLPTAAATSIQTVNGSVEVAGVQGGVRARTVNGNVIASSVGGAIRLTSVNGSVRASVARLGDQDAVSLTTVNGAAEATLPAIEHGWVSLQTVNGRITNDFPLGTPSTSRRSVEGTIGMGGRRITLETVNGPVRLRRSAAAPAAGSTPTAAGNW